MLNKRWTEILKMKTIRVWRNILDVQIEFSIEKM